MQSLYANFLEIMAEALPYLAFGFFVAGLLKSFIPIGMVAKYLGKDTFFAPFKAALAGAPLPLCSCSVIPVVTQLRRAGAGRGSMASFLLSAPETGVDSIILSYGILGPIMMVARIIACLFSAIMTGWSVMALTRNIPLTPLKEEKDGDAFKDDKHGFFARFVSGQRYAFTTLLDMTLKPVIIGLAITIVLKTYVPSDIFLKYGDGLPAMILMVVLGFPMYICASASTVFASGLLLVGVSPGAVLVFMLAGPASNIGTLYILRDIINKRAAIVYVVAVSIFSIISGLALNALDKAFSLNILGQVSRDNLLPMPVVVITSLLILIAAIKPLRPYIGLTTKTHRSVGSCCGSKPVKQETAESSCHHSR